MLHHQHCMGWKWSWFDVTTDVTEQYHPWLVRPGGRLEVFGGTECVGDVVIGVPSTRDVELEVTVTNGYGS